MSTTAGRLRNRSEDPRWQGAGALLYVPEVLLPGFRHRPGVHCGSTALADVLRLRGLDVTEAMAFGLGAGLGFYYLDSPLLAPTRLFIGRQWPLEETACGVLGAPFEVRTEEDPGQAWRGVRAALDRGIAPILSTDLRFLPYWKTSSPFNGHRVVLAGHDEGRGVALLADTEREELQEVALEDLERARASDGQPLGFTGRLWMEIDAPAGPVHWREVVADALRRQARHMLLGQDGYVGVSALERFAADVPRWHELARDEADRSWCFRFASQCIEKRGTGGGNFRLLYARFLAEAAGHLPAVTALGLPARMGEIAAGWTRLANSFKDLSGRPGAGAPDEVVALARELAKAERRYHEEVAARVSG
jgi:hypothetical protein